MPTTYHYDIEQDTTGGKPKWWVIRFPVERPQDRQRSSRHDTPQQAAEKIVQLQRQQT